MNQLALPLWPVPQWPRITDGARERGVEPEPRDEEQPREEPRRDEPGAQHEVAALVLAGRLSTQLKELARVDLTDNAWTMVSFRRVEGKLSFRLHHMFAGASESVLRALAGFTGKNRRHHGRTIDEFVRTHRHLIKQGEFRTAPPLSTRGRVHDLAEIFAALNAQHFENQVAARIGWGRRGRAGRRRSIKMGVYLHDQQLIRLHPALDDESVPRHFVELVVFHEMLHQTIPPTADGSGRRTVHGPSFRAAERRFPGYERARAWEKANLHLLLRQQG